MIARWGETEAVRRTVMKREMSAGLELLAAHNRLDCAYEQIVLDFTGAFDAGVVGKARENLARALKAAGGVDGVGVQPGQRRRAGCRIEGFFSSGRQTKKPG